MKQKRVREAMVELDYHPNLNARSLVSQSSQVIALVLPIDSDVFYQNPFFPTVLRGITQIASDNDYAIQICTGQNEERRLDNLKQLIYGNRVDGLIFLYSNPNDPLVEFAIKDKFPFLILGKAASPFVSLVDNDNIKAAFDATDYFIQQNYRKIAFMGETKNCSYLKTATKVIKKPSKKQGFLSMKTGSFLIWFYVGRQFLSNDGEPSLAELDAIMTTDILVAEGAPIPIRTSADNPDYFL